VASLIHIKTGTVKLAHRHPNACVQRLWRLVKKKPKIWRAEYARIGRLADG
jgi:hypothetical protein